MGWLYGVTSGLAKSGAQIAEGQRAAKEAEWKRKMEQIYADTQAGYGRIAQERLQLEKGQHARDLEKMAKEQEYKLAELANQHKYNVDLETKKRETMPLRTFDRPKAGGKPWEWEKVTQMRDMSEVVTVLPSPPNPVQARQFNQAMSEAMRIAAEEGVPFSDEHLQKAWDKVQTLPLAGQQQRLLIGEEQLNQLKTMRPLQVTALKALIGLRNQQIQQGLRAEADKTTAEARATLNELIRMTELFNPALMSAPGAREAALNKLADEMGIELSILYDLMRPEGISTIPAPRRPTATPTRVLPPPSRPGMTPDQYIEANR